MSSSDSDGNKAQEQSSADPRHERTGRQTGEPSPSANSGEQFQKRWNEKTLEIQQEQLAEKKRELQAASEEKLKKLEHEREQIARGKPPTPAEPLTAKPRVPENRSIHGTLSPTLPTSSQLPQHRSSSSPMPQAEIPKSTGTSLPAPQPTVPQPQVRKVPAPPANKAIDPQNLPKIPGVTVPQDPKVGPGVRGPQLPTPQKSDDAGPKRERVLPQEQVRNKPASPAPASKSVAPPTPAPKVPSPKPKAPTPPKPAPRRGR